MPDGLDIGRNSYMWRMLLDLLIVVSLDSFYMKPAIFPWEEHPKTEDHEQQLRAKTGKKAVDSKKHGNGRGGGAVAAIKSSSSWLNNYSYLTI